MKKIMILMAVLLFHSVTFATQTLYNFHPEEGELKAMAIGTPGFLKVHVKGEGPAGDLKLSKEGQLSGELTLNLTSLDTGIALRDKHLKEKYLETEKFADAVLRIENLPHSKGAANLPFEGILKLKDFENKITGFFSTEEKNGSLMVSARFKFKISTYPIGLPSFAGITVADEVEVEIHSKVRKAESNEARVN